MKLAMKVGSTSRRVLLSFRDSSSTTGGYLTGLTSSKLVCSYGREDDGNAGATVVSLSAGTRGTWSSGSVVEKDATNAKGDVEFSLPNAALASGSKWVVLTFQDAGSNNVVPLKLEIQLVSYDPDDAVRMGQSALPNATAGASGGLHINGSNAGTTTFAALTVTGAFTVTGGTAFSNASGDAFSCVSTGGNGRGAVFTGQGSGIGAQINGGATGTGLDITSAGGRGIVVTAAGNNHAVLFLGSGTGVGLLSLGGSGGGHGATFQGQGGGVGTLFVGSGGAADISGSITGDLSGSVGSVTTKTGFILASTGLDAIAVTDPGAPGSHTTLAKMVVALWRYFYKKTTLTSTQLKTYADDGTTVNGTATVSDDGTTQNKGALS
jgi:hypothetical protein